MRRTISSAPPCRRPSTTSSKVLRRPRRHWPRQRRKSLPDSRPDNPMAAITRRHHHISRDNHMLHALDLNGIWSFALDPTGSGLAEEWFRRPLTDTITPPGSVDEAAKTPLTTQSTMAHLSRRHPYVGKAWYQRSIEIDS